MDLNRDGLVTFEEFEEVCRTVSDKNFLGKKNLMGKVTYIDSWEEVSQGTDHEFNYRLNWGKKASSIRD